MKSPGKGAGCGGFWDDGTADGLFSPALGLRSGLGVGRMVWFFAPAAAETHFFCGQFVPAGAAAGVGVPQLCHLRRGHAAGIPGGAFRRCGGLGSDGGAAAAAGFSCVLAVRGKNLGDRLVSCKNFFVFCKKSICICEKMGYNKVE